MSSYRWNKTSITEAVAAGVLALIILVMGLNTYRNIRFEYSYKEALRHYGSNEISLTEGPLITAKNQHPSYPYLNLLEAAIAIRNNKLEEALDTYSSLARNTSGRARAAGLLGQAVTQIRMYDQDQGNRYLENAQRSLSSLRDSAYFSLEAQVQIGHVHLRRYDETGDSQHLQKARQAFESVRQSVENNQNLILPAFEDHLSGYGRTLFLQNEPGRARIKYERLQQLAPDRVQARVNRAYAMARYYAGEGISDHYGSKSEFERWGGVSQNLLKDARRGSTDTHRELFRSGVQLGFSLIDACFERYGRTRTCNRLKSIRVDLDQKKHNRLYHFLLSKHLHPRVDQLAKEYRSSSDQLPLSAYKKMKWMRRHIKKTLNLDPSPKAKIYLQSLLAKCNFLLQSRSQELLKKARKLYLKLDENPDVSDPVVNRNLCLAFYAKNNRVGRDWSRAHKYGKKYLKSNPDDEAFKTWFNNVGMNVSEE